VRTRTDPSLRSGFQDDMVNLKAVTFDFWSTLVDGAITPERFAQRVARLHEALVENGHRGTAEELGAALQRTLVRVEQDARESLIDVGPPGRWAILAAELGIPEGAIPYEIVEQAYEEITFQPLPDAMPHVHVAVEAMRRAGYRLAVICNTGMVGGQVLRNVLKQHDLFDFFDITVFSNEFGLSKPHPSIFEHTLAELGGIAPTEALHVGDLEELDVEGARRAGLHAARYVPDTDGQIETDADLIVTDWREFPRQIADYTRTLSAED
jgi:HAD superfamily hydrolase (TIGR01549 family)